MIQPIKGTETTKHAISAIVANVRKHKPNLNHVDYTISLKGKSHSAELITDENKGVLRNISILRINASKTFSGIRASIWNATGDICIEEKSYLSTKKALKKINEVLAQLLPENRANPQKVGVKSNAFGDSANYYDLQMEENFDKFVVSSEIDGSNHMWSGESCPRYTSREKFIEPPKKTSFFDR